MKSEIIEKMIQDKESRIDNVAADIIRTVNNLRSETDPKNAKLYLGLLNIYVGSMNEYVHKNNILKQIKED